MNDERGISIERSLIDACREVREMRAGKLPELTLEDFFAEMNELIGQDELRVANLSC